MLYNQCKQLKGLPESNNENPREALDFLTESVTKTIDKIAHIADVSFRPTRNSTGDDDDEENDSDNESKAPDGDETPGVDNALPDPSKLMSCSRNDITTFVKKLCKTDDCQLKEVDVLKSKQRSKLVTPWLCLKTKPTSEEQIKFFCLLQTTKEKKEEIKIEYNSKKRNINDTWIKTFASFLGQIKNFDWHNSFDHLPDHGTEKDDQILLWLANDEFEKGFFPPPRSSQRGRKNQSL